MPKFQRSNKCQNPKAEWEGIDIEAFGFEIWVLSVAIFINVLNLQNPRFSVDCALKKSILRATGHFFLI